jgi:hypothetical protein
MVIGLGAYFLTVAIPPIVNAQVLPFALPLHGVMGGALGVGVGAFVVTGALAGRDGVVDLAQRSVRWRVPVRWYLVALFTVPVGATLLSLAIYGPRALASPAGGWPPALAEVAAVFVLQLVLVSTCRGDRLHRVPPAPLAGPLSPDEAHPVRGSPVGGVASA